jgi:hypothetical protein
VAAPLSGMGLILRQPVGIGPHDLTGLQKKQAHFVRGHPRDKGFGFGKGRAQPRGDVFRVERLAALQRAPLGGGIVGVAPDLGNQSLGREAGGFFNRRPNDGTERQDGLMDGYEVDDVANPRRPAAAMTLFMAMSIECRT